MTDEATNTVEETQVSEVPAEAVAEEVPEAVAEEVAPTTDKEKDAE